MQHDIAKHVSEFIFGIKIGCIFLSIIGVTIYCFVTFIAFSHYGIDKTKRLNSYKDSRGVNLLLVLIAVSLFVGIFTAPYDVLYLRLISR